MITEVYRLLAGNPKPWQSLRFTVGLTPSECTSWLYPTPFDRVGHKTINLWLIIRKLLIIIINIWLIINYASPVVDIPVVILFGYLIGDLCFSHLKVLSYWNYIVMWNKIWNKRCEWSLHSCERVGLWFYLDGSDWIIMSMMEEELSANYVIFTLLFCCRMVAVIVCTVPIVCIPSHLEGTRKIFKKQWHWMFVMIE